MRTLLADRALRHAALIALFVAVPTALVLGPDSFLLMLARAFMRQWVLVFVLLGAFFALRRWAWGAIVANAAAVLIAVQVPWPLSGVAKGPMGAHLLRVGQFNVLQPNDSKEAIIAAARTSGADVLSFQEVDDAWAVALDAALSPEFPYRRIIPRQDCYGIALYSRLPVDTMEVIDLLGAPAVRAVVRTAGGRVAVTAVHTRSPMPYGAFVKRNGQLEILANRLADQPLPQVVIGDLNAVGWDDALLRFRDRVGLKTIPAYEQATFPSMLGIALIPIDHVMGSFDLAINNTTTTHLRGSDHRALIADISRRGP